MKLFLITFLLSLTTLLNAQTLDLKFLQAEKDRVEKLEFEKYLDSKKEDHLQKLLGFSFNKSMKNDCGDVDIDIDVDVNTSDEEEVIISSVCEARWSDGTCREYGADTIGEVDPYCEARWSDGTCRDYGSDQAGTCYPNCVARWSDGKCKEWGPDICL